MAGASDNPGNASFRFKTPIQDSDSRFRFKAPISDLKARVSWMGKSSFQHEMQRKQACTCSSDCIFVCLPPSQLGCMHRCLLSPSCLAYEFASFANGYTRCELHREPITHVVPVPG
eukprot:7094-Pleurochrysis_carterae.AAC.1